MSDGGQRDTKSGPRDSRIHIVTGAGFGDEGKGTEVDRLVRRTGASTVVRFCGGPQACHNVVTEDGTWHTFSQFGSGSLVPGTDTLVLRNVLVKLESLEVEAEALREKVGGEPLDRITLSHECAIVTPANKMLCQMREIARGNRAHGSCGMGVGLTATDRMANLHLNVGHVTKNRKAAFARLKKLNTLRLHEADRLRREHPSDEMERTHAYFVERMDPHTLISEYFRILSRVRVDRTGWALAAALARGPVVMEGAQGALLDPFRGFWPYCTKTVPTPLNALAHLKKAGVHKTEAHRVAALRCYAHRHGAGPLPTEDGELAACLADPRNPDNRWQGQFRVGWPDALLMRYGMQVNGKADSVALSCLDQLSGLDSVKLCVSYVFEGDWERLGRFFDWEPVGPRMARIRSLKPFEAFEPLPLVERTELLSRCVPFEWLHLPGWKEDISGVRSWDDLPDTARFFVETYEKLLGAPVRTVSVGPRSDQVIER